MIRNPIVLWNATVSLLSGDEYRYTLGANVGEDGKTFFTPVQELISRPQVG